MLSEQNLLKLKELSKEYYDILTGDLAGINLTRILDEEDFFNKQILDSYAPVEQSEVFSKSLKAADIRGDIGFGGGFPLLVLSRMLPDLEFIGLEARRKKVEAVEYLAAQMNITNVEAFHERLEMVLWDQKTCLTLKAVGKCEDFLKKVNFNKSCRVFFYKGPGVWDQEKIEGIKNWNLIEKREINVPGAKRWLLGFEGTKKTYKINNLTPVSSLLF